MMTVQHKKYRNELNRVLMVLACEPNQEIDIGKALSDFGWLNDDVNEAIEAKILTSQEGRLVNKVMNEYHNVANNHFILDVFSNERYVKDQLWKDMRDAAKEAITALSKHE